MLASRKPVVRVQRPRRSHTNHSILPVTRHKARIVRYALLPPPVAGSRDQLYGVHDRHDGQNVRNVRNAHAERR
eukprot:1336844-Prymnesium_polylepis.1